MAIAFAIFIVYEGDFPCYLAVLGIANVSSCKLSGASIGVSGTQFIQLSPGGGGVNIITPTIGAGPVVIQPPVIHL